MPNMFEVRRFGNPQGRSGPRRRPLPDHCSICSSDKKSTVFEILHMYLMQCGGTLLLHLTIHVQPNDIYLYIEFSRVGISRPISI